MSKVTSDNAPTHISKLEKQISKSSFATCDTINDDIPVIDDLPIIQLRPVVEKKRFGRPWQVDKYRIKSVMNHGSVGKVKHAIDTTTNKSYAIKVIRLKDISSESTSRLGMRSNSEVGIQEIQCMIKLSAHPHIINVVDYMRSDKKIFIVMEKAHTDLFDAVGRHGPFSEQRAKRVFRQMMRAVHYSHISGIAHRDIKPENILLDEYGRPLLCDFGMAMSWTPEEGMVSSLAGTVRCLPPECIRRGSKSEYGTYPFDTDIWACGVTLFYMLTGNFPFEGRNDEETLRNTLSRRFTTQFPPGVSQQARALIYRMLSHEPEDRPTAREVLEDSFICIRRQSNSN